MKVVVVLCAGCVLEVVERDGAPCKYSVRALLKKWDGMGWRWETAKIMTWPEQKWMMI